MRRLTAWCGAWFLTAVLAACGGGDAADRDGLSMGDVDYDVVPWHHDETDESDADVPPGTDTAYTDPDWVHGGGGQGTQALRAALQPASNCDEALAQLKALALVNMEAQLSNNYYAAIDSVGRVCPEYVTTYDAVAPDAGWYPEEDTSGGDTGASEYSTTNNQVADVDEADFLKNDGKYIYILADGRLQILDAWPAEQAHRIGSVAIAGEPRRLFVYDDVAVVYASMGALGGGNDPYGGYGYGSGECTYGYFCDFTGDGRTVQLTVWDISDKTSPTKIREATFSGSYIASRRIDDAVYTVVWFPQPVVDIAGVYYWPQGIYASCDVTYTKAQVAEAFDALYAHNVEVIQKANLASVLPGVNDRRLVDGQWVTSANVFGDCDDFFIDTAHDGTTLTAVFGLSLGSEAPLTETTVVSSPGAVYASKDALYMATRHTPQGLDDWYYESASEVPEASTVHRFALDASTHAATYYGSGVIKGRALNQFAMDEHDGYLRVATTTGTLPGPAYNTITVLQPADAELKQVGLLDHLAPDEDIRAVRFNGDVGFVVTFKKTDPLFVIDLADPTAPAVRGELKIPGFSTYMHLMDATHILALGYDADDQGDFAWFNGVLLQIFDVSDLANPTLMHKEVIGTRGTSSEALTDHLAFTYFKARDALAIPITICEGGGMGRFGDQLTFSGLRVYHVTLDEGFSLLGGIPHVASTGDDFGFCSSWWTEANSLVKRSIFMEDWVFSITPAEIKVSSLADLEHPVATLDLEQ